MPRKPQKPKLAHCRVTPYTHPRAKWRVSYPIDDGGKIVRRYRAFTDEAAAWAWAETKDIEVAKHGARFGSVTPEARRAFDAFRDLCDDLLAAGVKPPRFEDVVSEAIARIRAARASTTVALAVDSYIAKKEAEHASKRHVADLRYRLGRFAEDFGGRAIGGVTTADLDEWLAALAARPLSPRSVSHFRGKVHGLFAHAKGRGWIADNPCADALKTKVRNPRPRCHRPADAGKILLLALRHYPELVPALALGYFAGLRTSEILRVGWDSIDLSAAHLRVDETKTGKPRLAPMTPAARAWLATCPRRQGPVWHLGEQAFYSRLRALLALPELAKVPRIPNAPRHSFISYRCAETRNPAAVADEAGNSSNVVSTFYRELVTPAQAAEYFAILPPPEAGAQVIQFGA